jgi:hypothetical protein
MTPATLAATLLIVATLADIASTEYALRRGLSEGNPVAAKLMSRIRQVLGLAQAGPGSVDLHRTIRRVGVADRRAGRGAAGDRGEQCADGKKRMNQ